MPPHGNSLVAGHRSPGGPPFFHVVSPPDRRELPGAFATATETEVDEALRAAMDAFPAFRASDGETRARFLEAIADRLHEIEQPLLARAHQETGLPPQRLAAELARTTGHLRMFARIARENAWLDARIETADPDRQPVPKPDLRRVMRPIGPVVVFGASNFPLAYSVAGGDTASALATGNPVVVKAHEAHPGTSELTGEAIAAAAREVGLPGGVFSLLQGDGRTLGPWLAKHPATRAIGFTGSLAAGRALFDAAASRPDPIPVFAEMGSLNPVILLPGALGSRTEEIAAALTRSATTDGGQFCTKPGLWIAPNGDALPAFRNALQQAFAGVTPATLLHAGICANFDRSTAGLTAHPALRPLAISTSEADAAATQGRPLALETTAASFLAHPELRHEVFGPFALLVVVRSPAEIPAVLDALGGQLTAAVFADDAELAAAAPLLDRLAEIAGRVIVNGVPTGVEVGLATNHGGPWPASTDVRFTSVGAAALQRFIRPVAYQNCPQALLPPALRDDNPLGIARWVDGEKR
jgi:NADP-dependent aldehyde dehydrogenase